MRFLFRMLVFGIIALALLPAFAPERYRDTDDDGTEAAAPPSAFELTAIAGQAISDIRNICVRRPDICETGSELIAFVGTRARDGLEIAYEMFRHGHPSMQDKPDDARKTAPAPE